METLAEDHPFSNFLVELPNMKAEPVAAIGLGPVKGKIGFAHHSFGIGDIRLIRDDSDAGAGVYAIAIDQNGGGSALANLSRQRFGAGQVVNVLLQDREFITAEAGNDVVFADTSFEPIGDHLQKGVADWVP